MLMEPRVFAVGDIHGCVEKLHALLERLPLEPEDTLVFLGDYINRGPDTRGVLDILLRIRARRPNTVFLTGNHEFILRQYVETGDTKYLQLLRELGVEASLASYDDAPVHSLGDLSFMPETHRGFLHELRLFYRWKEWLFVHAGVPEGRAPEECDPERLLTLRGTFLSDAWQGPQSVVFGHTPFLTPLVAKGKIGIDTGAVYGNLLTAVELPALRFHHA